ncbi:hypothetical protein [Streptomyces sp. SS]|uniref:hypothetical protein n=1 Tax=Streptomyces sp. SS TaxID=260742 RepID=UPI000368130B|nr:hypothetical protein [Streptomyces sp. SS]
MGFRQGETLGMRWRYVDLEKELLDECGIDDRRMGEAFLPQIQPEPERPAEGPTETRTETSVTRATRDRLRRRIR